METIVFYLAKAMGWIDSNPITYFGVRTVLFLYAFFILFVAVTALYRAHLEKKLSKPGYILGWPVVVLAGLFDVIANFTVVAVICLEPPREWLVTDRFRRYIKQGEDKAGFRFRIARGVCNKLLDYFDPRGSHCYPDLMVEYGGEDTSEKDPQPA